MTDIMKQYNQLQRAYESQAEENADLAMLADQYKAERDALQAKLDELQRQEPPKCVMKITVHDRDWTLDYLSLPVGKYELFTKSYVYNAAHKALEPLTEARVKEFYEALKDDKRSQNFTNENWFQCGIATAEAAHGITKGTP